MIIVAETIAVLFLGYLMIAVLMLAGMGSDRIERGIEMILLSLRIAAILAVPAAFVLLCVDLARRAL